MAIPGILQQLVKNNPMITQVKQMFGAVNAAQNPQMMINQLMNNNPQMKTDMDAINQDGGDPKKAFYDLAEQKGINPQDILDMLK